MIVGRPTLSRFGSLFYILVLPSGGGLYSRLVLGFLLGSLFYLFVVSSGFGALFLLRVLDVCSILAVCTPVR